LHIIAALTRGAKLAEPQAYANESHRGKALDEVSAAIPGDAVAGNK